MAAMVTRLRAAALRLRARRPKTRAREGEGVGEDGGARSCGRGGLKRQERQRWRELCSLIHGGHDHEQQQRERESEGVEEDGEEFGRPRWKRPGRRDARQQGQVRARAWWPRREHVSPIEDFHRVAGRCWSGPVGTRFWATFGPNWTMSPK
jgi:hypothetical protein